MSETIQKVISIQSKDKTFGTIDNFICEINNLSSVHWISFQDIIIPMSHYPIDNLNNTISFNDGANKQAVLKNGFYNTSSLIAEIKLKMDTASGGTLVFTVTYDNINEKITISSTGNFDLKFDQPLSPYAILGFDNILYTGASTYTSPKLIEINRRYQTFNVYSNQITKYHGAVRSSNFKGSLFARINNSFASPKTYLHYTNDQHSGHLIRYNKDSRIKTIDIRITDIDNKPIEFNGIDKIVINLICYIRD